MTSYHCSHYVRPIMRPLILLGAAIGLWAQPQIPAKVPFNTIPTRVLGHAQAKLSTGTPNLVEGRELNSPSDVAIDTNNRVLYVADSGNNRVLGWKNPANLVNGAPADIVIGQNDRFSTLVGGPTLALKSGLAAPTAVAVDTNGNLYVADAGNNRILRYRQPFTVPAGEPVLADFVIGQVAVTAGRDANTGGRSAKSLALSNGSSAFSVGLRFDSGGNLWVTDAGNSRVLRYPALALTDGKPNNPDADLVIGQSGFTQVATPANAASKITIQEPAALAFDNSGRLYVADVLNRVLVYTAPYSSGMAAQRIMGSTKPVAAGQPSPAPINEYTVGVQAGSTNFPPEAIFAIGNIPFVVDRGANRILRFPAYEQWPLETDSFSPAATAVIGQNALQQNELKPNSGLPDPTGSVFFQPGKAVFADGKVYVVDSGNNRVLIFNDLSTGPISSSTEYRANVVLGQTDFIYRAANLAEGREFNAPNGIAVFTGSDGAPQMFIADTNNNRILGFRDARKIKPGDRADLVIGQDDFGKILINSPFNSPTERSAKSLALPRAVAFDKAGNLWVADTGNSRVMRFPPPFSANFTGAADLVIGQANFNSAVTDASSRTMAAPIGIAFTVEGLLAIADATHNRVLLFVPPFTSGMAATKVIGQPDFVSTASGTPAGQDQANDRFNQPRAIDTDVDDRLYVADALNNRIQVFGRVPLLQSNPAAVLSIPANQPLGVAVSKVTGEIWTVESGGTRRYQRFDSLVAGGVVSDFAIGAENAGGTVGNTFLALAFDQFNSIYGAEATNRVSVYYPVVAACNGASFVQTNLAPGMIATLSTAAGRGCEKGGNLVYTFTSDKVTSATGYPLPRTLENIQVLLNGIPAPLYFVSDFQINFVVPNNLPPFGTVDLQVVHVPTGRIFGAGQVTMSVSSPGLFTTTYEKGTQSVRAVRQVAALNEDGTVNSEKNPALPGKFVTLYGTGVGFIPGLPADGTPATGAINAPAQVRVVIGTEFVEPGPNLQYSGAAPGLAGVWQINARVPTLTAPGRAIVGLVVNDTTTAEIAQYGFVTGIWVK